MEGLQKFSSLGVLSIIFLVFAAVIHSIRNGEMFVNNFNKKHSETETANVTDLGTMLWPDSFWDVVQAFPIIIFAFSCQVNVCAIFEELRPSDEVSGTDYMAYKKQMMKRITRFGITLCISLYLSIGIFGYLDFAHGTVSIVLYLECLLALLSFWVTLHLVPH
jgi:amino acid permease